MLSTFLVLIFYFCVSSSSSSSSTISVWLFNGEVIIYDPVLANYGITIVALGVGLEPYFFIFGNGA